MKSFVAVLVVLAVAAALYLSLGSNDLRTKAQAAMVNEICSTNVVADVIAAYPQASMSKEDLGRMTLGEGLEKLKAFQATLPTVLYPTVSRLSAADAQAWGFLIRTSREGLEQAKAGKGKPIQAFAREILASARQRCPEKVSSPYSEFAVGAMLGYFAKQSPS